MTSKTGDSPVAGQLQSSQQVQALLDAAADGIVILDQQGCIQGFNHAAERLFGYSAQEVLGGDVNQLIRDPGGNADRATSAGGASWVTGLLGQDREIEGRRKDGSSFPAFLSVGMIEGAEPARWVGFVRDVSFRRRAEQDLHRLQERLTQVSRLATVGEMSAALAHELNQPLAAVANYAQACNRLLALPDPDIEEVRDALQQITSQAVRAGDIIHRLRAFARNDTPRREPTDINMLVEELTELIQLSAKEHHVHYRLELAPSVPKVEIDRSQMQQVILNLVRNGLEALGDNSPEPRQLTLRTRLVEDGVEVIICDNGPGVAADMRPRLFEAFSTTKSSGTGLGLASSRTIVKAHQGSLEYQPNSPKGTCFTVHVPLMTRD
jgi:two-component system sensor kinase FixL